MTESMQVDISTPEDMVLTRTFDAPLALVWDCWTDPGHLAVWWGPAGMTNRIEQDLRPGGYQNVTMIDSEGNAYPIQVQVIEVVPEEKLIGRIGGEGHENADVITGIVMTVTFEKVTETRTKVTIRQTFPSQKERDANMEMGAETGWSESFEKLDQLVARLMSSNT